MCCLCLLNNIINLYYNFFIYSPPIQVDSRRTRCWVRCWWLGCCPLAGGFPHLIWQIQCRSIFELSSLPLSLCWPAAKLVIWLECLLTIEESYQPAWGQSLHTLSQSPTKTWTFGCTIGPCQTKQSKLVGIVWPNTQTRGGSLPNMATKGHSGTKYSYFEELGL